MQNTPPQPLDEKDERIKRLEKTLGVLVNLVEMSVPYGLETFQQALRDAKRALGREN